jgi:hypothetical protein
MASGHEHNGAAGGNHDHHEPRVLPASLAAPPILSAWRTRALIVFAVATILSVFFAFTHEGRNHILRAYLLGYMISFGFAGGGLVVLMLQYVSGGKWGLLLRRPLEAMTRTIWFVGCSSCRSSSIGNTCTNGRRFRRRELSRRRLGIMR